jgi:hypothetical protein
MTSGAELRNCEDMQRGHADAGRRKVRTSPNTIPARHRPHRPHRPHARQRGPPQDGEDVAPTTRGDSEGKERGERGERRADAER